MIHKEVFRPEKVKAMLRSRACRKSVMIGMDLDKKKMLSIVSNLSTLDSPWNCPHGRPTMRFL
jgi:DNA mismatch repair protein PMS2